MDKLLLRPVEAAEMLSISRATLYELMAAGAIESVKLGHMRRIPAAALAAWVEKQRVTTSGRDQDGAPDE